MPLGEELENLWNYPLGWHCFLCDDWHETSNKMGFSCALYPRHMRKSCEEVASSVEPRIHGVADCQSITGICNCIELKLECYWDVSVHYVWTKRLLWNCSLKFNETLQERVLGGVQYSNCFLHMEVMKPKWKCRNSWLTLLSLQLSYFKLVYL